MGHSQGNHPKRRAHLIFAQIQIKTGIDYLNVI